MRVSLLFNTVRYLKFIQIRYRIQRKLFPRKRLNLKIANVQVVDNLHLAVTIFYPVTFKGNNTFSFLNLEKRFSEKIDWEFLGYGRLWTYNLNYFEYLNQEGMTREVGEALITKYIAHLQKANIGLDPYPVSLRAINWIRFFIRNKINKAEYTDSLYAQLKLLSTQVEYHLLGNHLLENGFAFLWGAYYFNDEWFYRLAKKILLEQLDEQILKDGAHFELSPMYHCIMLLRVLDCYNLIKNNSLFQNEFVSFFEEKSCKMLSWLKAVIFQNGDIPLFNDAAFRIAPAPASLFDYAERLGLSVKTGQLRQSGYRKLLSNKFEVVVDVAEVGPDYQPGHAHADTFSFELHVNNRPVVVDTGTSTYDINEIRFYERSTAAHNTVVADNKNSSEVWSGHRVGKRACVTILEDMENKIVATHSGYKSQKIEHLRSFSMQDESFVVNDMINSESVAYLHFHPIEEIEIINGEIRGIDYSIFIEGATSIEKFESYYAPEFNKVIPSKSIRISFKNKLKITFK